MFQQRKKKIETEVFSVLFGQILGKKNDEIDQHDEIAEINVSLMRTTVVIKLN